LTYELYRLLGQRLGGAQPVLHVGDTYQLNVEAGVGVDVPCFEALAAQARTRAQGDPTGAAGLYSRALRLYGGDLCGTGDVHTLIERERLRAIYLNVLAQLADYCFRSEKYMDALEYAQALLATEPCREDAHRLAMRCYVRMGQRSQAMRQYELCTAVLRAEFDTIPEEITSELYDQVRRNPHLLQF
jgi:DNA-binding SARP family transcriptional activator